MPDTNKLTMVGIAASAGGLEATSEMLRTLPTDLGAIYVLAQHMSPSYKSLLAVILSRETALAVEELSGETEPKANTLYVTPPNNDVTLRDGKLVLAKPLEHPSAAKPSVDRLFKAIARNYGERSVGIVLSGTGSDGSYGVQAIHEAGGVTIAQDIGSAKFEGMPSSAIETGCIDLTLTPQQIGQHLTNILAHPRDLKALRGINDEPHRTSDLFNLLLARTRIDFRSYKPSMISRRIDRRMTALGILDYDEYVNHCRETPSEIDALKRDLLISVTRFFRDSAQFDGLRAALRERMKTASPTDTMRIWVAGCATGEEAYSVAMLAADVLTEHERPIGDRLQVFATDIDERALKFGRAGAYPGSAAADIPEAYMNRYVRLVDGTLEISSTLKKCILFTRHDLIRDPPFMNLDVATIRNVLIYFDTDLQRRVLQKVHYALKDRALLFLGKSETTSSTPELFEDVGSPARIYRRRSISGMAPYRTSAFVVGTSPHTVATERRDNKAAAQFDSLARMIAPTGFIANRQQDIVRIFGQITDFVELNEQTSVDLSTRNLREGLRTDASSLISVCLGQGVRREGRWRRLSDSEVLEHRVVCTPVSLESDVLDHALIAIESREMAADDQSGRTNMTRREQDEYLLQLEERREHADEALEHTVEALQTSNEELQTINEEMQSTNEELQAANEELETMNEELQSTNEELISLNEEMQVNSSELTRVNSELETILEHAPSILLVVDQTLTVRRASAAAARWFALTLTPSQDTHLSALPQRDGYPDLITLCDMALRQRREQVAEASPPAEPGRVTATPFVDPASGQQGIALTIIEASDPIS